MAEYLAPGVYLEEIDTGAKPIEGVSTSTAGVVGLAERGPLDRPILITSAGEFERWFGGPLPIGEFTDPADPDRAHCYLPDAVRGFFTNGGKRLYVVRVAPEEAERARMALFDRGAPGDAETVLLRRAGQGEGAAGTPLLYLLDTSGVAAGEFLRIGDGSRAEYLQVVGAPLAADRHVPLSRPLARSHATTANALSIHAPAAIAGGPFSLDADVAAGAGVVVVDSPVNLAAEALPFLLQMSANGASDLAAVIAAPVSLGGSLFRVALNEQLGQAYPAGTAVELFSSAAGASTLAVPAAPGDAVVFADADVAFADMLVELDAGTPNHEVRRLGELRTLALEQPLPQPAPAGSAVAHVTLADGAIAAKTLTGAAGPGTRVLALNDRVDLAVGQVLRVGAGLDEEFGTVIAIPGERGAAPDAGNVTLAHGLSGEHAAGAAVVAQDPPAFPGGGHQSTATLLTAEAGDGELLVAAGQNYAAGDAVRLRLPDGAVSYHRIAGSAVPANTGLVTLNAGLARTHEMGETAVERQALIELEALDVGAWGNRLLVSVEDEPNGLLARAHTVALNPPLQVRLSSLTGVEPGTLLEVANPATGASVRLKARRTDPSNGSVTLDAPGLDAATLAALGAIAGPLEVASREFRLVVRLRRRPDPAVPSRNNQILALEAFRHLSMDHRHSRYFPSVLGAANGPPRLEDGRPEGESQFVRVTDLAPDLAATEAIRPGPETLVDLLPSGVREPARHPLVGGDDSLATLADPVYLGADHPEPLERTGLHALRNMPQVSMVAIPGQASAALQAGLIAHCELMRYRFAVLDSATAEATLAEVQAQRQAFDTKYAALYYPWLTVPDPMPDNLALIRDYHLPPSGHVMGIFARTDEERGVHKAPANEVVRGITGLSRRLNKGEHDILNPSPVNINVIRDFRPEGRGIRVWGARCITSDSDHKYVPVRRLLIFLEQSIERGLQWVVFEPNAEPLWARVRRSVANFLTDVWRDGALEGTKPEEAFFVKCDRTTMTQTDIDNGRLICVIGVAPVKPAEFVIIRIGLLTASSEG
ncbi:MAG: phage tail sheath subtilisin-like domain-containing protein [Tistlia sp.]|uniref:phage tail sheath subtilisin-like domain-containing protein n=1 Tax=Tistlia sp. TaxID=3057121 RepID=UPI0034A1F0A8